MDPATDGSGGESRGRAPAAEFTRSEMRLLERRLVTDRYDITPEQRELIKNTAIMAMQSKSKRTQIAAGRLLSALDSTDIKRDQMLVNLLAPKGGGRSPDAAGPPRGIDPARIIDTDIDMSALTQQQVEALAVAGNIPGIVIGILQESDGTNVQ